MNSKADLKAAREAIGKKEYTEAIKACKRVLLWEGENYNAWVFLGVAHTNLENDDEAEEAYKRAIEINSNNMLGWHGLVSFYEKRKRYQQLTKTIDQLLPRLVESGDGAKVADYLKKLLHAYQEQNDQDNYLETLKEFLPQSSYYDLIKDQPDLPSQIDIWKRIVQKMEKELKQTVENEVASRRFRMNAGTPAQILTGVEGDVYSISKLGTVYRNILDLIPADASQEQQVWKLKLLKFSTKQILGTKDSDEKHALYQEIIDMAHELKNTDDPLPLQLLIESTDAASVDDYDWHLIKEMMDRFPDHGLAKLAQGYELNQNDNVDQAFELFSEGIDLCPNSLLAYLCLSWIYYQSKEYETGLEYATRGKDLVKKIKMEYGISMRKALCSLELCMAHCYQLMDKKYHMDAMTIYKNILQNYNANQTGALEGMGLILMDEKRLDEALQNFEKVTKLDEKNHTSVAAIGWIYREKKDYEKAIEYISKALMMAEEETTVVAEKENQQYGAISTGGVAEYQYRLGRLYWDMQQVDEAVQYFMQAVKSNPYLANGFTYLGHYYREIKYDHARARKCYQKAYMLDPLDDDAALHLSDYLITEDSDLEEAETIFRQVTKLCPRAAWAWRRLGYHNLNTQNYNDAISCFQKALRIDTGDVHCWEGLAEAYSKVGRYVAALRAFGRATQLNPHSVHAHNEQAYVQQKVGLLDDAIAGFQHTLDLAAEQKNQQYIPALAGLAETYLEHAKEDLQAGFTGRASDSCNNVFRSSLKALQQDNTMIAFWKWVGDACAFYRHIPKYLNNCAYDILQSLMTLTDQTIHEQLHFPADDMAHHWISEFLALEDIQADFSLPTTTAMDILLSCATQAYKQAIALSKNHPSIAPSFWHDLAVTYYHISLNSLYDKKKVVAEQKEAAMAIQCAKLALKLEPTQYMYWNTLGVIAMTVAHLPKLAQYAFVKAIEFNNRSAIPWTNYGFLCLAQKDYELANQAFETAHALDPEWISAWMGQAYVASLWGDAAYAATIFEHAFESNNDGSVLEPNYGYANSVYQKLTNTLFSSSNQHNKITNNHDGQRVTTDIVVTPVFALEKLTEKKPQLALGFNLLGLLLERLGQYDRASEAFASAILALEAQMEQSIITEEEGQSRLAKVHTNLGRTLCASGDFEGAINATASTTDVYARLNAGLAYYFMDQLEESLSMFEMALEATQNDIVLRQDVIVLLSKVLWALEGEEQRSVAKDQLFSSISENPNYLPAIFSLCAMGMLENDETLTAAALQELAKVPASVAYESDREQYIPWLFSKFFELKNDRLSATRALVKSVHQTPWLADVWRQLSKTIIKRSNESITNDSSKTIITTDSLTMSSKSRTANSQSEAYQYAAVAEKDPTLSKKLAQRAVMTAPWRVSAWEALVI
ncbi:hypothetical protein BDF20DRAFT_606329 [Mycotypha africana]|uniref:uncharacterized protein n=1 Tax=Mycotypha africana TaxID=64632 RepID=UPI002301517E|nr:uncharacterized protein BDF20DRAFT_606329 [Mycotypha africana]KAI8975433.1 hypothetical protein BDF20DRAFT_606329 [Mycotypha africana]